MYGGTNSNLASYQLDQFAIALIKNGYIASSLCTSDDQPLETDDGEDIAACRIL